jgi:hypothetical protein
VNPPPSGNILHRFRIPHQQVRNVGQQRLAGPPGAQDSGQRSLGNGRPAFAANQGVMHAVAAPPVAVNVAGENPIPGVERRNDDNYANVARGAGDNSAADNAEDDANKAPGER